MGLNWLRCLSMFVERTSLFRLGQKNRVSPVSCWKANGSTTLPVFAAGARLDRGRGRVAAAKGVLSALRFAAHKLGLTGLADSLASPVLESWQASDKWSAVCPKEAYPLPLCVVAKLEIAFLECGNEDAWLLGCMLLMIWGGLRWSDVQRLQLATLTIDKSSLRARLAHQNLPQRIDFRSPILWGDSAELGINLCSAIGSAAVTLSPARLSFGQTRSSIALCLHARADAQMPLSICRLAAISSFRFFVAQLQGHDISVGFAAGCPFGHEGRARAPSPTERLRCQIR